VEPYVWKRYAVPCLYPAFACPIVFSTPPPCSAFPKNSQIVVVASRSLLYPCLKEMVMPHLGSCTPSPCTPSPSPCHRTVTPVALSRPSPMHPFKHQGVVLARMGYLFCNGTTNPMFLNSLMDVLYKKWRHVVPACSS